jgi:hypothetical protein
MISQFRYFIDRSGCRSPLLLPKRTSFENYSQIPELLLQRLIKSGGQVYEMQQQCGEIIEYIGGRNGSSYNIITVK